MLYSSTACIPVVICRSFMYHASRILKLKVDRRKKKNEIREMENTPVILNHQQSLMTYPRVSKFNCVLIFLLVLN